MMSFQEAYPKGSHAEAVEYCQRQWFEKYPEKFVYCYSSDVRTFNSRATSRVEGAHATIKAFVRSSGSGLNENLYALKEALRIQQRETFKIMARNYSYLPPWIYEPAYAAMFQFVVNKVTHYALNVCHKEWSLASLDMAEDPLPELPCGCRVSNDWGLPCRHIIHRSRISLTPLTIDLFDKHWHLISDVRALEVWGANSIEVSEDIGTTTPELDDPNSNVEVQARPDEVIVEPVRRRGRGGPRPRTIDRRILSQHERVLAEVGVTAGQLRRDANQRRRHEPSRSSRARSTISIASSIPARLTPATEVRRPVTIAQARTQISVCIELAHSNRANPDSIDAGRAAAEAAALSVGSTRQTIISAFADGMRAHTQS
ncbi:hypothetical protein CBS101457_004029 [Exobasidium rhododendri]|nr:hypothetical protein CBS101457_004029 [Exobasidium rhododendri]